MSRLLARSTSSTVAAGSAIRSAVPCIASSGSVIWPKSSRRSGPSAEVVARSWAGTPVTSAWVGFGIDERFHRWVAAGGVEAAAAHRDDDPIGLGGRYLGGMSHRLDGCDAQCRPQDDEPVGVRAAVGGEGGGHRAAHAVADDERRLCAATGGKPLGGVGQEVGGVVALQGDAADPFGAAVGALIERVDAEPGGGEPLGDVRVATGVLAAAMKDRHDRPQLAVRRP